MIEKNNASNAGKRLEKWMKGVCGIGVPRHVSIDEAAQRNTAQKKKKTRRASGGGVDDDTGDQKTGFSL